MALAAEYQPYEAAEPEDIETVGEEGISPYGLVEPGYVSYFSDIQLQFLRSVVDKVAKGKHYAICAQVSSGNAVNYYLFVGNDVTLSYLGNNPESRINCITFNSLDGFYNLVFREMSDIFGFETNPNAYFYVEPNINAVGKIARIYYDPSYSLYDLKVDVNGDVFDNMSSVIISDLAYYPDISSRGEVQYDYAACVILASFLLFSLFRSLWRSIRGRVD